MNKYKAVISDIDGTLVPFRSESLPSARVTSAICRVIGNGGIFSLASGRPYPMIAHLVKHLCIPYPCITDNGAVIQDGNGKILWESNLPPGHAAEIISLAKSYPSVRASTDQGWIENPLSIPKGTKVRKFIIQHVPLSQSHDFIRLIETTLTDVIIVSEALPTDQGFTDIYIADKAATKQHSILMYAKLLGIEPSEIIGIGDGVNDFPLLMACGFKVAMGNAIEDLKAIADYIAPSVDDDGLAHVLDAYMQ